MTTEFIHLRVHSSYSLLEGAITPKALVGLCKKYQMPAVAVTDSRNMFCALEFSLAASGEGIQPIIGCAMLINSGQEPVNGEQVLEVLPLIAQNEIGYYNLLKLCSKAHLETRDGTLAHIDIETLKNYSDGLIALTGGVAGGVGQLLLGGDVERAEQLLVQLKNIFADRLYVELMRHGIEAEEKIEAPLIEFSYKYNIPLVATNDVYFPEKEMYEAHDALMCIAEGRYVAEENRKRLTEEHYFKSPAEMKALFKDIPEAIQNTVRIAKRCAVMAEGHKPILPHFPTEEGRTEAEELRAVAEEGLQMRLETQVLQASHSEEEKQKLTEEYTKRLHFELDVIISMQFPGYFLIVSDFIRWSKRNGIPVGPGRGSGAGSLVAWSLEITDLDPIRFGLLFERFLNPERISMPDFDVDFCQEGRDEVIRYVQAKYGNDQVAQIITFGKLQARAVLRDVGRVLQMPYGQVDRICKLVPNNPASPVTLVEAIEIEPDLRRERDDDNDVKHLLQIAVKLEGLNRHASTHAAGVVIGDRPLGELVPLYRDPRSDMPVTQYSMKYAEIAGLVKFDFLGLKTLTVIKQAVDLVNEAIAEGKPKLDISTIPLDDVPTFKMLGEGDAAGVFQLESSGMRDTLCKMKPDRLEELIALISLYRPGPMDNIPTYIACKQGEQQPDYLHPKLEDILKETYGVIIYQEQVMQIAQVLSGYTLGGADLLRRAMGKKIKEEMDKQREIFVDGAVDNNVDKSQADGIFDLVAKFAGYGFNKSHAAAYALISYQTAYLKANYPVEFFTATMNLDIHDTDKLAMFSQEVRSAGITMLPPDINKSQSLFAVEILEDGTRAIRYGLGALKNVGITATELLVKEREAKGEFKDIFDFAGRGESKSINKRQVESLAKAGAFDSIHPNRKQVHDGAEIITRYTASMFKERESTQVSLFGDVISQAISTPALPETEEWQSVEKLAKEAEAVGFFLTSHPLHAYTGSLAALKIMQAARLAEEAENGKRIKLAGIVTSKRIRNSKRGKYAFIQFSDASGTFEVSVFKEELLNDARDLLDGDTPVLVIADVRRDEGGVRLIADSISSLDEAIAYQSFNLTIYLDGVTGLPALKKIIGEPGKGGRTTLSIVTSVNDNQEVTINLPGMYPVKPSDFADIEAIDGVVKIQ